jgi:alkyl hydroperoxide reductase subunit AhpF
VAKVEKQDWEECMALLKDSDREYLRNEFKQLTNPVKLAFFTQGLECEYCPLTQQVLEEVATLSDKIQLQTYNFAIDKEQVANFGIARVPAIAVLRVEAKTNGGGQAATEEAGKEAHERDYGIRFYGVPAGFEFASLLGDILDVSLGQSGLSEQSKSALAQLKDPLHLQVFTTPT